jgi:hypothetical protein
VETHPVFETLCSFIPPDYLEKRISETYILHSLTGLHVMGKKKSKAIPVTGLGGL